MAENLFEKVPEAKKKNTNNEIQLNRFSTEDKKIFSFTKSQKHFIPFSAFSFPQLTMFFLFLLFSNLS